MRHLSSEELVDLLDNALPAARRAHLAGCEACRAQAETMSGVLEQVVESGGQPEPSPLFWDHLSARIKDGVAAETSSARDRAWWQQPTWATALAAAALAFAVSQALPLRSPDAPASLARSGSMVSAVRADPIEPADDIERDEAWALVRSLADQVEWDETHEAVISARPDAAERLTAELTSREQSELALLLERELKRPGT
jgi:hypothetical protein